MRRCLFNLLEATASQRYLHRMRRDRADKIVFDTAARTREMSYRNSHCSRCATRLPFLLFFLSQLRCNSALRRNGSGETARQRGRRAFLFSTAEHRGANYLRLVSHVVRSFVARRKGDCREFRYKNNGRVPHYFTFASDRAGREDASRIVNACVGGGPELANCSRSNIYVWT